MSGFTEFISFPDYRARYLEPDELMRRKPDRMTSAKVLPDGDMGLWLQGSDRLGPFCGYARWSYIRRNPLIIAWVHPFDIAKATDHHRRQKKGVTLNETLYFRDEPVGKVCQDQFTGCVTFVPNDGHERLATRKWADVRACKKAVFRVYRKEEKGRI